MESVAGFLAGFAFFMVGLKMFSTHLNQLTSIRFRRLITQFTPNNFLAGVWGVILALLTAGNTVLTPFVAAGFQTVNALNLRKSIHLIAWSRVGACFFIYLAGFNIRIFILFLIGIAGTSFALSKPKRTAALMASIFALGLVLFGIQEIKHATRVLTEFAWFSDMIAFANTHPEAAFGAGFIFLIFAQSLFGALVVVLGLLDTNIFGMQQAILFTYGAFLGEAVLKMFYLPALKDAFKQGIAMLPIFYFVAFAVGLGSHLVESYAGVSLIEGVSSGLANTSKEFLAHVNFGVHLVSAVIISLFATKVEAFLEKLATQDEEGAMIEPVHIPAEMLDDPNITMELIDKEELRLVSFLPRYQENLRSGKSLLDNSVQEFLHENLSKNFGTIRATYQELLNRGSYHASVSARILENIERQNLLMSLETNLNDFGTTIDKLRRGAGQNKELSARFLGFSEAIDAILMSLIDVMKDPDPFYVEVIETLTSEREDMLKAIRTQYAEELTLDQQVHLIKLVNLFESTIWIIKKTASLYASRAKHEMEEAPLA